MSEATEAHAAAVAKAGEASIAETGVSVDETIETAIASVAGEEETSAGTAPVEKTDDIPEAKPGAEVKSEKVVGELAKAGETPEEKPSKTKDEGMSIEDIASDIESKSESEAEEGEFLHEEGVSEEGQKRLNKKIGKYVKDRNVAQDETKAATERANKAETALANLQAEKNLGERPKVPLRENSETDEAYQEEMVKWKDDDDAWKATKTKTDNHTKTYKDKVTKDVEKYNSNVESMRERFPDPVTGYDAMVTTEGTAADFGNLCDAIISRDHAPEIFYYLANNTKHLDAIKGMDAGSAVLAIGEISGQFKSIAKKTTKVPRAITPLKGKSGGPKDAFSTEEMDRISKEVLQTA